MENDDDFTFDVTSLTTDDSFTINLDNTYGTTTTHWAGDSITDVVYDGSNSGTFTIDTNTVDTIAIGWIYDGMNIDINKVERMCKEYPSLEKVWRNFKNVYDMVKQDYDGKVKAGELDDDIPF